MLTYTYLQTVICEEHIGQPPLYAYIITYSMLGDACLCDLRDNVPSLAGKNNKNIFILLKHLQIQVEILLSWQANLINIRIRK